MQITEFIRDSETFSIGAAAGKGRHYRCAVANATGRIEYLEELTGGCRRPDDRQYAETPAPQDRGPFCLFR